MQKKARINRRHPLYILFGKKYNCRKGMLPKFKSIAKIQNYKNADFRMVSLISLMHHRPIKAVSCVTDVIELECWRSSA